MEPIESPPTATAGGPGVRRSIATAVLAIGLLAVGGTAVVFAASPEPSTSAAPGTTTQPTADDGASASDIKSDCPEGADGRGPGRGGDGSGGTTDGGTTDGGATDDGTDTESSEPSTTPDTTPSQVPSPDVDDTEV